MQFSAPITSDILQKSFKIKFSVFRDYSRHFLCVFIARIIWDWKTNINILIFAKNFDGNNPKNQLIHHLINNNQAGYFLSLVRYIVVYYDWFLSVSFYLLFVRIVPYGEYFFRKVKHFFYTQKLLKGQKEKGKEKPRCLKRDTKLSKLETQSN